ncbi:MAG: twitching motility protein PilT [Acidobacteriota bacterium]|jgi:twitching motility protein PilT
MAPPSETERRSTVTLLDSLLDAIVRLDGEALIMHVGEKPYVVLSSTSTSTFRGPLSWGQVELSSRPLSAEAVMSMLGQMLSPEQRRMLDDLGAVEHEIDAPGGLDERFVVTAARGGDDLWVEVRRRPRPVEGPALPEPMPAAAIAADVIGSAHAATVAAPLAEVAQQSAQALNVPASLPVSASPAITAVVDVDAIVRTRTEAIETEAQTALAQKAAALASEAEAALAAKLAELAVEAEAALAAREAELAAVAEASLAERAASLAAEAAAALAAKEAELAAASEASLAERAAALVSAAEAALAAREAELAAAADASIAERLNAAAQEAGAALAAKEAALAAAAESALVERAAALASEAQTVLAAKQGALEAAAEGAIAAKAAAMAAEMETVLAAREAALAAAAEAALAEQLAAVAAEASAALAVQQAALDAKAQEFAARAASVGSELETTISMREAALAQSAEAAIAAKAAALEAEAQAAFAERERALAAATEAALSARLAALAEEAEATLASRQAALAAEADAALAVKAASLAAEAEAVLAERSAALTGAFDAALEEKTALVAAQGDAALSARVAALEAELREGARAREAALTDATRAALEAQTEAVLAERVAAAEAGLLQAQLAREAALAAAAQAALVAQAASLAAQAESVLEERLAAAEAEMRAALAHREGMLRAEAEAALAQQAVSLAAEAAAAVARERAALEERAREEQAARERTLAADLEAALAERSAELAAHAEAVLAERLATFEAETRAVHEARAAMLAAEAQAANDARGEEERRAHTIAVQQARAADLDTAAADARAALTGGAQAPAFAEAVIAGPHQIPDAEDHGAAARLFEIQPETAAPASWHDALSADAAPDVAVVLPIVRPTLKLQQPVVQVASPGASTEASLVELLRSAAAHRASTVYAVVDTRPMMRIEGQINVVGTEAPIAAGDVERFIFEFAPRNLVADAAPEWTCAVPGVGRVRCVTFHDQSGAGLIIHLPAADVSTADEIGLTPEIQALCGAADGLIVITGPRASGKSSMLNALVDLINRTRYDHVVTIESRIRVRHERRCAFISQREVRGDGDAIASAARAALREGADVLVIEDLRAPEALGAALDAARAGRLVLGSISAPSAPVALERLVDAFPADRRPQVRASLAGALRAVVAQVLVPKVAGGRTAAREVLLSSPAVRKLLLEGATGQLAIAIESGRSLGMRPMVDALGALVRDGIVDIASACSVAPDRAALIAALERDGVDVSAVERRA